MTDQQKEMQERTELMKQMSSEELKLFITDGIVPKRLQKAEEPPKQGGCAPVRSKLLEAADKAVSAGIGAGAGAHMYNPYAPGTNVNKITPKISFAMMCHDKNGDGGDYEQAIRSATLLRQMGIDGTVYMFDQPYDTPDKYPGVRHMWMENTKKNFASFAVRRNFMQMAAVTPWVFHIDADEFFCPSQLDRLAGTLMYIEEGDPDCAAIGVWITSFDSVHGVGRYMAAPRLTIVKSEALFDNWVHEDVGQWVVENKKTTIATPLLLRHEGYEGGLPPVLAKAQRNLSLYAAWAEHEPDDLLSKPHAVKQMEATRQLIKDLTKE